MYKKVKWREENKNLILGGGQPTDLLSAEQIT